MGKFLCLHNCWNPESKVQTEMSEMFGRGCLGVSLWPPVHMVQHLRLQPVWVCMWRLRWTDTYSLHERRKWKINRRSKVQVLWMWTPPKKENWRQNWCEEATPLRLVPAVPAGAILQSENLQGRRGNGKWSWTLIDSIWSPRLHVEFLMFSQRWWKFFMPQFALLLCWLSLWWFKFLH